MTPENRQWLIQHMGNCPDEAALNRVWESMSDEAQRDAILIAAKDDLAREMRREAP